MTRDQLIREVARQTGVLLEVVDIVVDTLICEIKSAVEHGDHVSLNEFIKIKLRDKRRTQATHFPTGQRMTIKETKTPWVTVSRKWRNEIREKYKHGKKK